MQSDNTEPNIPVTVSLGTAGIAEILSHTRLSYARNFKPLFFSPHFNLPYFTLSLEMPTRSF